MPWAMKRAMWRADLKPSYFFLSSFFLSSSPLTRSAIPPMIAPAAPAAAIPAAIPASSTPLAEAMAASTTCKLSTDKASYWTPSLRAPDGSLVKPIGMQIYYSNRPHEYGTTRSFPANFRLIAGGPLSGGAPRAYWNCLSHDDVVRLNYIPDCGRSGLRMNLTWPNCWDGVHLDSANHRSHVVYPVHDRCPATRPVKIPQLRTRVWFPVIPNSSEARLVDGNVIPHADFWNTWNQTALIRLVRNCLHQGSGCGLQRN